MNLSPAITDAVVLRQIAERTNQVFFIYGLATGRVDYVNPAFEEVWGRSPESVNQNRESFLATIHPEDRAYVLDNYERLRDHSARRSLEFRIVMPDESVKWILVKAYLVMHQQERHSIAGFADDITDQKESEVNLMKFNIKKNGTLDMLSHDLGGPLGMIQNLTAALEERTRPYADEDLNRLTSLITDSCRRSGNLINDLLNQEFLESAEVQMSWERVELVSRVESFLEAYRAFETYGKRVFEVTASSPEVFAVVDAMKLTQIFGNLISNAVKFTRDDGRVTIRLDARGPWVVIAVADDGIGIPSHLQPFLFDRFTKARRPGVRGEQTMGLGMSLIKRVVDLHRGRIRFESEENRGTTFYVEIPAYGPEDIKFA
ncbi:MAG: PAS domain-containing sensor histidine kinase [Ferruginibacter sp.]|nr:PAS domain-containing sensor histidine kinase [Cytophagales bacterium]